MATEMLFVREALEQATSEAVAAYHASRFPAGEQVIDMTVGIGSDLIALARRGPVVGFELDAERAEAARHNLTVHGLEGEVRTGDSLAGLPETAYAWADPARRVEGRRTLKLEDFSPDVRAVAHRMAAMRLGAIKLSPMLSDETLFSLSRSVEFLSFGRECREAILYLGSEAIPGRAAVLVETGDRLEAGDPPASTETVDAWFFEADPAAIRAHCLGPLCQARGLKSLGDSNGYLTGPRPERSPWLRMYRVLYAGSGDMKATRRELRRLAARPILKQRGVRADLEEIGRKMGSFGDRPVFVALWSEAKHVRHTILEPE